MMIVDPVAVKTSTQRPPFLPGNDTIESRILSAARQLVIAQGAEATTMASIARAARISRPTLYSRYENRSAVVRQLLNDEIVGLLEHAYPLPTTVTELVHSVVTVAQHALRSELLVALLRHDPETIVTYQYERFGRSQKTVIQFVSSLISSLQAQSPAEGTPSIRTGDPDVMAIFVVSTAQCIALQSWAITPELPADAQWTDELIRLLEGYLYS